MKLRLLTLGLTLAAIGLALSGCNIFGWTASDDPASLIDEGQEYMRDAEYDKAVAKFAEAMAENPADSEARYYHAKATLHASGFNSFHLNQLVDTDYEVGDPLPFTGPDWPPARANALFQVLKTVCDDLKPIYDGLTTGVFSRADIEVDYNVIARPILQILIMRDTDFDGEITDLDYDFIIFYDGSNLAPIDPDGFSEGGAS